MREQLSLLKAVSGNMKQNLGELFKDYPLVVHDPAAKLLVKELEEIDKILERMVEIVGGNGD